MAIKFNDYFEFPREFDMSPYTAAALSEVDRAGSDSGKTQEESSKSADNEDVNLSKNDDDQDEGIGEGNEEKEEEKNREKGKEGGNGEEKEKESRPGDEPGQGVSTKYRLRGVVVHSGQASGGHYYSFIYLR